MKRLRSRVVLIAWLALLPPAVCQGSYVNLDFESVGAPLQLLDPTPGALPFVAADQALPGWQVYIGTAPQTAVLYNQLTLGSSVAALLDAVYPGPSPIQGGYMAALVAGIHASPPGPDVSLAQTGTVPAWAHHLSFSAIAGNGPLELRVGGVEIPVILAWSGGAEAIYRADVSQFAGQQAELRFTAVADYGSFGLNVWYLDAIGFSPIPEPSATVLLLLGGMAWGCLRLLRKRYRCCHSDDRLTSLAHT